MLSGVCATAQFTAAARSKESQNFDRLFYDPYAEIFAQEKGFEMLEHFSKYRNALGSSNSNNNSEGEDYTVLICALRTKYFDDLIYTSLYQDNEIDQIVLLGCGCDTRSFRLFQDPPDREIKFYEVDYEQVITFRENILPVKTETNIIRYPIISDVTDTENWEKKLLQNNFSYVKKTIWILEGLLMYIEEEKVHKILRKISQLSSPNSVIIGDTYNVASITSLFVKKYNEDWAMWGAPFIYGTDDPDSLLIKHGFSSNIIIAKYGDDNVNYGRFPRHLKDLLNINESTQKSSQAPKTFLFTAMRDDKPVSDLWDWVGQMKLDAAKKQLLELSSFVKDSKIDKINDLLDYFNNQINSKLSSQTLVKSENIIDYLEEIEIIQEEEVPIEDLD